MTVFDWINSKNIDEFAEWLYKVGTYDDSPWMQWWNDNYCGKCEPEVIDDVDCNKEFVCAWCELHDKCKYFKDMEDIPTIEQTIKMWLESEV